MSNRHDAPLVRQMFHDMHLALIKRTEAKLMDLTTVIDCTGANLSSVDLPDGVKLAAYITGSGDVPWSDDQLAAHPDAVLIDQAPVDTPANELADVIDMESQAATLNDLRAWVRAAQAAYAANKRPGQRHPAIYCSQSNVTPVANTLVADGITSGVNLWVAEEMPVQAAVKLLEQSGGPFPIVGIQYQFNPTYDVSLFATAWLDDVSGKPAPAPPAPGTQAGWRFCSKCQGLFYGPGQAASICPRGAQHDGSQSHDYTIGYAE